MRTLFRPADWPLAIKLLIAFLVVAIVPLLIVGTLSQRQASDGLLNQAKLNLANTARRTSNDINNFLNLRVSDMRQTAALDTVTRFIDATNNDRSTLGPQNVDQTSTYNILKSQASSLPGVSTYVEVASAGGQVELTSNAIANEEGQPIAGEPANISNMPYFQEAMKGTTYLSNPKLTIFQDNNVVALMYVSSPILDTKGQPAGVVVIRFSLASIWQIVDADQGAAGAGSYTMLVDDTDNLGIKLADSRTYQDPATYTQYLFSIVRQVPSGIGRGAWVNSGRFPDQFDYATASSAANSALIGSLQTRATNYNSNAPYLTLNLEGSADHPNAQAAYAPINLKDSWKYFVVVPDTTYSAAADNITTTLLIATVLAILVVILVAFFLSRLLTTPVRRIGQVLGRIGIGDFGARVPVGGQDELGRLSDSLNAMFDNTLSLIQSREEKEELQGQITRLLEEISTVAEGDLTVQAEVTADITGAIADSFNLMIEELRRIIINIQNTTGQASNFFEQMVQNTQQIDKVSSLQASRVVTVSGSVEDINRSIQQVSEAANLSANVAQEARQNAHQGNLAVSQTIAGMNRIRGNVQETAKKIKRLGESSQQIGEIVKLIDDIADQTNMLALNAAIQAAMAGEQGKGFSVVSEEVRRLAERSATATREIAALVKSIQDDTAEAVIAMEESTREVVEGSKVADDAGHALSSIETVVERLANLITNISVVSRQQATSSRDITGNMVELSQLTQEAATLRRQSANAVEQVARTADELRVSVSAFKVTSESNQLESGKANEPAILDAHPVASNGTSASNGDKAVPEYYQYMPHLPSDRVETYQSPAAADGGSWDEPAPVLSTPAPVTAPATVQSSTGQTGLADGNLDLNSWLNDDKLFEPLFQDEHSPKGYNSEDEKDLPPALG